MVSWIINYTNVLFEIFFEFLPCRDHVETEVKRESLANLATLDPQVEKDLLVTMDLKEIQLVYRSHLHILEIASVIERI